MKSHAISILATVLGVTCFLQSGLWAQTSDDSTGSKSKSWTSVTEPQNSGAVNPTRTKVSHTESGNRALDKQSLERIGPNGNYEPYLDVEKETVKVDSTTVRIVERSYARDSDGRRRLVQVTEEESRNLPGDEVKTVRTTSNPDLNGGLRVVQKEIEDTKQTSPNVQETKTSVLTPDVNGGLTESVRTEQRETKNADHTVQFQKSTLVQDGGGRWQAREVRQGVIKEDGAEHSREESVLQPDSEGKLAVVQRTVSKEAASASGETRGTTETYSVDLPGAPRDGSLHPVQRVTTVHRADQGGRQSTETQIEQPNPGSPASGMRVTGGTIDIVRSGADGTTHETRTIQSLDGGGSLGAVWVDMGTSDKPSPGQVNVAPAAKPGSAQTPAKATPAKTRPPKAAAAKAAQAQPSSQPK